MHSFEHGPLNPVTVSYVLVVPNNGQLNGSLEGGDADEHGTIPTVKNRFPSTWKTHIIGTQASITTASTRLLGSGVLTSNSRKLQITTNAFEAMASRRLPGSGLLTVVQIPASGRE
jgi:hypothetical protein